MNRPSVYRGFYHSQRLHLSTVESGEEGLGSGTVLEQSRTVVLHPVSVETNIQPSWSISSLFGGKVVGRCVLAKSSNVYLQMDGHELKSVDTEIEAHRTLEEAQTVNCPLSQTGLFEKSTAFFLSLILTNLVTASHLISALLGSFPHSGHANKLHYKGVVFFYGKRQRKGRNSHLV